MSLFYGIFPTVDGVSDELYFFVIADTHQEAQDKIMQHPKYIEVCMDYPDIGLVIVPSQTGVEFGYRENFNFKQKQ